MDNDSLNLLALAALLTHWSVVIGLSARIIMRRRPIGVLLAWIALILSIPVLGVIVYLFVGENRIGDKYIKRVAAIRTVYDQWQQSLRDRSRVDNPAPDPLQRQVESVTGFPVLAGNRVVLLPDYESTFRSLIRDIEHCRSTCHLEFYIWHPGGLADELFESLREASRRGVHCRVILDALGSKPFLQSDRPAQLRDAGVEIASALPVGLLSTLFSRADLRNHRKIAVIDGKTAYTGSQNLVDPRFFKQNEGVGQWIDATIRISGPLVETLAGTFIRDWESVTGSGLENLKQAHDVQPVNKTGNVALQIVPSGPYPNPMAIQQIILAAIYSASEELVITTPYFVPDESLMTALVSAAHQGVKVTLIIPAKNDSRLVDYASRSTFGDLLDAGVNIATYECGLLHTKSITVDGKFCVFGSVNMDMRSLWLNFEISVLVYNRELTAEIQKLQESYLQESTLIEAGAWKQRPFSQRFVENAAHLAAPLL